MDSLDQVFRFIGALVLTGGGISLIVFQAFKHLATRWLDSKFEERLQAVRHAHEKEIEALRFKISGLLDRATKLHQREFEVLPEAWYKLNDAFWVVRVFVAAMQSYPDLDSMNGPQLEEFLAESRLTNSQKAELRQSESKVMTYKKLIYWHKLNDAENKTRDAYSYFMKNGIFIDSTIRTKFSAIHDLIWNALIEDKINEQHNLRPRESLKISELNVQGEAQMKELERDIHARLWPSDPGTF
jgi:hypothetical protein